MYWEDCLSLLKDLEQNEDDNYSKDEFKRIPAVKWHKVNVLAMRLMVK